MVTGENHIGAERLFDIFGGELHGDRLLYPQGSARYVDELVIRSFKKLYREKDRVALVDGAFDVPHPNHEWYLRHCKLLAAEAIGRTSGQDVGDIIARNKAALAVTVDADDKIARKKSNNPSKGGVQRPIYPWEARASRVAGYAYSVDDQVSFVADLVTPEGDSDHQGTLLESSLHLAYGLSKRGLLDDFIIYGEHSETVREARNMGVRPIVISEDIVYEVNPQTGKDWSSSGIIGRAQGGGVANPITRPGNGKYE